MKFAGYIGIGLLVAGGFIFFLGFKVANYNLYFLIAGGIIAAIGFYSLKFLSKREEDNTFAEFDEWRKNLKSNGTKIEVNFEQCELKSNKYREAIDQSYSPISNYMALDALVGNDNTEYNNIDQSIIVFNTELKGRKATFYSPLISKEKKTLEFLLADKKSTKIYIDKINKDNYYFDLEFLWRH
ncbi:hypothetical protein OO013_19885 [Mangrovivirga sp. M17]|uniref:DUF308 domain-containing protein n=1 Tax=Mangrovivirga halotolerans TaxID=2993936 RepID=A0ABT3RWJ3_9BACT|nr:hypothetical protein [Mangrovivirga halotolerans]MCX2746150.1 hypothetical protein [Mangrovivirga halotolerans]